MIYSDDNRGKIQFPERKQQLIDYSGLRYSRITATDIDGYFEVIDNLFIFYEFKYHDAKLSRGQRVAFERLIDALQDAGKESIMLICRHDVSDTNKPIIAHECIVDEYRYDKRWWNGNGKTSKMLTDSIIKKLLPEKALEFKIG